MQDLSQCTSIKVKFQALSNKTTKTFHYMQYKYTLCLYKVTKVLLVCI